ncbi:ammonium transporter [Coraliomargarita sp. SDUM461003]|uniref:Ammonium transporter n=1 Tax=Thalassobacterium maritimum TaxID=3041265 RepID=A0ABU1ASD6_9BACT|nr:ammonium transporter [Coraliomargarita sp. SDUM461003]MBT64360.1 ammonium transporter [Puniceicoccaceae bacterium]MDQ8206522.1 ammonium transporter [Coraliomargarita sp. SDUM461003]HBR93769.1 ammonium transporter [Opitutae bacterium]
MIKARSIYLSSLAAGTTLLAPTLLSAQEVVAEAPSYLSQNTGDILWYLMAAVLVFFMQAGFALVETGLTRAKNACNIMMKNMLDFSFGVVAFAIVGYALMYGDSIGGIFGWSNGFLFMKDALMVGDDLAATNLVAAEWLFQVVFAATAATIASGVMAERTKFSAYIFYSIAITCFVYPIVGHWIWSGDGWLAAMGMRDYAGSTVVHSVGAWAGLAGAIVLGARKGKFDKEGKALPIPGHNMPLATLGCFILIVGWFGFNAGSTLGAVDDMAYIAMVTMIAAATGCIGATMSTWLKFGKPDLSMTLNGALAGLVSITACCGSVSIIGAMAIGLIGGIIVVFSVLFFEQKLRVDDPVGAVSVHGICGIWGTLSVGLFGSTAIDAGLLSDGLLYGGTKQIGVQMIGILAVFAFVFPVSLLLFKAIKATTGLRVSESEELEGLDISEHGNEAYADFQVYADLPEEDLA